METLPYILKTQICFSLMWLVYRVLLHGSRNFAASRLFLMSAVVLSFIVPAISIPFYDSAPVVLSAAGEITTGRIVTETVADKGVELSDVLMWGYLLGVMVMVITVMWQMWRLFFTVKDEKAVKVDGNVLIYTKKVDTAYSFFNYIFVNGDRIGSDGLSHVVAHEISHVRLRHSVDAVVAQLFTILFWWNPFVWLWSRSLKEVHEFQADSYVLNQGYDSSQYITLIVKNLAGIHPEFASGFSYSLIKRRLTMIAERKCNKYDKLRVLFAIPAVMLIVPLFAFTAKPAQIIVQPSQTTDIAAISAPVDTAKVKIVKVKDATPNVLSEVVVIGYNKDGKSDKNAEKSSSNDAVYQTDVNGKQAKVVIKTAGKPVAVEGGNGQGKITVVGSGTEKDPIVFIDGKQVDRKVLNELDPNKIKRINVVKDKDIPEIHVTLKEEPFQVVENMPKFEGKDVAAFRNWVMMNMRYPAEAVKEKMSGRVLVSFVVDKDGDVIDVSAISSPHKILSDEVVAIVRRSPKWTPGEQRGQKVNVEFKIPIDFNLQ